MRRGRFAVAVALCAVAVVGMVGCAGSEAPPPDGEGLHSVVPDVTGFALETSTAKLEEAGYKAGAVTSETIEAATAGTVARQDPVAGTALPRGGSVDLVVSAAPASVAVPDVVGSSVTSARMMMSEAGLVALPQDVSGNANEVDVVRQDPEAGSEVPPGSEVKIYGE